MTDSDLVRKKLVDPVIVEQVVTENLDDLLAFAAALQDRLGSA